MLYFLSSTLISAIEQNNAMAISILDDLSHAWTRGVCLVDSRRKSLSRLSNIDRFHLFAESLLNRKQGVLPVYKVIEYYVVLSFGKLPADEISILNIENGEGRLLDCSLLSAVPAQLFVKPTLVCENLTDVSFIERMVLNLNRDVISDRLFRLQLFEDMGGGNTMAQKVTSLHNQQIFALVIVDSDKHYPLCPDGATCTETKSVIDALHSPYLWYYKLNVMEAENLIPLGLINAIHPRSYKRYSSLKLSDNEVQQFLIYYDWKLGFTANLAKEMKNNDNAFFSLCKKVLTQYLNLKAGNISKLLKKENVKGEAPLCPGFGSHLLKDSTDRLSYNVVTDSYTLLPFQSDEWNRLGRLVISHGIAMQPQRV